MVYLGGLETDIWLADADGENPREFLAAAEFEWVGSPDWSPDGKSIVYARQGAHETETSIERRGLDEDVPTVLVRGERITSSFLMFPDRLVFARTEPAPGSRDENLWEIEIDPRSGNPRGEPRRLTDWVGFRMEGFSTTADGSQIAFTDYRGQTDVFVGELTGDGRSLVGARRLTLDDREDRPFCWTPDGNSVVFSSDRYGDPDLFVQRVDRQSPEELAQGPDSQTGAVVTPDGESFLFWETDVEQRGIDSPTRLLRVALAGGPTELVLETRGRAGVQCAAEPGGTCVLSEKRFEDRRATFSQLDPVKGRGDEMWSYEIDPDLHPMFDLSPDGRRFAVVRRTKNQRLIHVLDARTGEVLREIAGGGPPGFEFRFVAWSPDGDGFYVSGNSPRGIGLLRVEMSGETVVLLEGRTGSMANPLPSPDGRHLAFGRFTDEANVWMIERF